MRTEKLRSFFLVTFLWKDWMILPASRSQEILLGARVVYFLQVLVLHAIPMCLKPLRLLCLELCGPVYTDFNNMVKRQKSSTFSSFLPQSASFLPACVSVNTEQRFKGHLALNSVHFFLALVLHFFLASGRCLSQIQVVQLWSLKQVFKKANNVLHSPEDPLQK